VSQLLTLYITPVYYVYIEGARLRLTRRRTAPAAVPATAAPHPVHAAAEAPMAMPRSIDDGA